MDKITRMASILMHMPNNTSFYAYADSQSMFPLIMEGDKVRIVKTEYSNLKTGDIICFFNPIIHKIVIHRIQSIIRKEINCSYITKGDFNVDTDQFIVKKSVFIGKAQSIMNNYRSYILTSRLSKIFRLNIHQVFPIRSCKPFIRTYIDIPIKFVLIKVFLKNTLLQ
jgi:signal peptidase I